MAQTSTRRRYDATVQDVAETFGVHTNTVYTMAHDGRLPFIKFGRQLRFDLAEVTDALTRHTHA